MNAKNAAGLSIDEFTDAQKRAADVDENGSIDIGDATGVLTYYAQSAAGLNPSWDDLFAE